MKKKRRVVAFLLIVMLLLTDVIPVSAISAAPDCGPEFYTLHAEESGENAQKKEESFLEERSLEEEQNEEYVTNRKGITVKKSLLCDDPNCLEEHVGNEIDVPEEYRVKVSKADLLSDRALERLMTDVYVGMTVSGNAEVAFWGTPATAGPHQVRITDGPLAGVKGTGWCINHGAANPGEGFWQWCSYSAECTSISGNFADWKITLTPPGACTPGSVLGYQRVGMSATVEFEEPNGNLEIAKSSAKPEFTDGNDSYTFANAVYGLYQNGKEVGRTLTDSHGWGIFKGYKKGNYILKEITPPKGYALDPTEYPVTINSSQTTRQEVKDYPQSDPVAVLLGKIDKETNADKPQGSASLEGAEFTFKFYGVQSDTDPAKEGKKPLRTWVMKTDERGFTRLSDKYKVSGDPLYYLDEVPTLPLGTVTIQETKAPKGYVLNPEVYVRKITPAGSGDRVDTYNMPTIPETVARGDLEIKKYNQADDGTITYLQGVRFTITSKTTGKQVAEIITDRNGWGSTYDRQHNRGGLPFDTYIVEEDISTTPEGMENVKPFEVTISQDKQVLEYEVENKDIVAPVKLVKQDATTGKTIPLANAEFELLDAHKNPITVKTYNPYKEYRTFKTDASGSFTLPKRIKYGTYYFREVKAPNGYLYNGQEIQFKVTQTLDWSQPIVVTYTDQPAKGKIRIEKTDGTTNQPLSGGASFEIRAKDNIVTPDGTVRAWAGTVVDRVTTDRSGKATSKELFLGNYEVIETQAPNGYLLNRKRYPVSLVYQDQNTNIVYGDVTVTDQPGKGKIRVTKKDAETDKIIPGGATFEIRAKNDILTPDGTVRARKGEVVDTITTNRSGKATSKELFFGTYEVKEINAPNGYLLNHNVFDVTLNYQDQETELVYSDVDVTDTPVKGNIRLEKRDAETDKIIPGGATFEIRAKNDILTPDGTVRARKGEVVDTITTKTDGKAESKLLYLGDYEVQETQAPNGYLLDHTVYQVSLRYVDQETKVVYGDVKATDKPAMGQFNLYKKDKETGKVISGKAVFEIYAKNDIVTPDGTVRVKAGTMVERISTEPNGYAVSKKLYLGNYTIQEVAAPDGYIINPMKKDITLSYANQWTEIVYEEVNLLDEPVKGKIRVEKQDAETGKIIPKSANFIIIAKNNIVTPDGTIRAYAGEVVDRIQTNEAGKATSKELYLGTYLVRETQAPTGYLLQKESYEVTLSYKDQDTKLVYEDVIAKDQPAMGQIKVKKTDVETNQIIPTGATYEIHAKENIVTPDGTIRVKKGELVDTITTGKDGTATSKKLYLGTYEVQETKAPEGYVVNETKYEAVLTYKDQNTEVVTTEVTGTDEPVKGKIQLRKSDVETDQIIPVGAIFDVIAKEDIVTPDGTVRAKAGTVVDTMTTGKDGTATSKALYLGSYLVKETKAPEGYLINETVYEATLKYKDQNTKLVYASVKATDAPAKGKIQLQKQDAETGKNILKEATFEIRAKEDIVTPDGTVRVEKGTIVETIKTGVDGKATSKELYLGTYEVQEVKAPEGYLLNNKVYETTLKYKDQVTKIVYSQVDATDQPVKGKIKVTKHDVETDKIIPTGATFEIRAKDNIVTPEGTIRARKGQLVDTITTGEDGTATSKALYLGTYLVKETKAPEGYLLNEQVHEAVLTYKDQVTELVYDQVKATDQPAMGQIKILKQDEETGKNILGEATFEIRAKENIVTPDGTIRVKKGTLVETIKTNNEGVALSKKLYLGSYTVQETKAPFRYAINSTIYDVKLIYQDQLTEVVTSTQKVPDMAVKGRIHVTKTDVETNQVIPNKATFQIIAKNDIVTLDGTVRAKKGEVVDTITTNRLGKATSKVLYLGTYLVKEVQAPNGYLLNEKVYEATLSYEGQDTRIVFADITVTDRPAMGQIKVVKKDVETDKIIPVEATFEIKAKTDIVTPDGTVRAKAGELVDIIKTGKDGKAQSKKLYLGTYLVQEVAAPNGYLINEEVHEVTLTYKDQNTEVIYADVIATDKPAMGQIKIKKTDATTNQIIPGGATFEIKAKTDIVTPDGTVRVKAGTVVDTITTGEDGIATSKALYLGSYTVLEVQQPDGYLLNKKPFNVSLAYKDQTTEIVLVEKTVTNTPTKVVLTKKELNSDKLLEGVTFKLWKKANETQEGKTFVTGEDGTLVITHLVPGMYCLQEVSTIPGYVVSDQIYEFTIAADGRVNKETVGMVEAQNDFTKIDFTKHDLTTEKEIEGGRYQVLDQEGTVIDEWIGTKKPHRVNKLVAGQTYIFREILAPEGYLLAQDVTFTVDPTGEVQKVQMFDELVMGTITVEKTDAETKEQITGAIFKVYAAEDIVTPDGTLRIKEGTLVETITTEQGRATTKPLFLGKYRVREQKAAPGYVNDPKDDYVTLEYQDQNTSIVGETVGVKNRPTTIVVEKICNETKQPLAGVQFAIWNKSAKEETIQIHTTGTDGKIIWKHVLPGRYCVQEMKSAEGYVLDAKIHEIVVDEDGRIDRKEIGTLILQNEFTKIDLSKHDISTGKEIKGGTYQVLDQEGHVLDEWIGTGTPHRIEKLIVGKTYIFREMIAPEGYLLAQDVPFTIAQTKEVQKVEMYDELAMGRIAVKKTDHETKESVTGALFKVYAAEDIVTPDGTVRAKKDELVDVIQTEKGVAQTQKLFLGTYRVVESQPSPGYAKDNQEHLIELKYKDQNTALVLKTLEVENKPTTLIVEKVRKGTKVVLEGVTFKVWNKADETKTAIEYVTDETGRFVLKYLIPGVYCIQEVKPKEGYLLNKTIYEVVVNEDGAVILEEGREPKGQAILTVENALEVKIETPKPAVKTGDSLPGSFWSTMALLNLSILMLIARDSLFSFGRKRSILNHRRKQKREGDV